MKTKILVVLSWIIASGYIISLCFRGMNLSSDLTYITGILGLAVWFAVVTPVLYKKLFKRKKDENPGKEESVTTSDVSNSTTHDNRVHNKNRAGDGRNRS